MGLVGFPFATIMWQGRIQERLDDQIASPELQHAYRGREIETGNSLNRIKIRSLPLDTVVVEGTMPSALRAGAGHGDTGYRIVAGGEVDARSKDGRRTCQAIEMPDKATRW